MLIHLVEITAWDPQAGAETVLRYATGRGYNHPSAPAYYEPRVVEIAAVQRSIRGSGGIYGPPSNGTGVITLANAPVDPLSAGPLDGLALWGFGRVARVLLVDDGAEYETASAVQIGIVEQPTFDGDTCAFTFRDPLRKLDQPLASATYAGTNAAGVGLEGDTTLKGTRKPVLYGIGNNYEPVLVNGTLLIYQLADAAVTVDWVRDGGVPLSAGISRTLSDLQVPGTPPTAGFYDCHSGADGTFIRLGQLPTRQVTVHASEGTDAARRTVGQIYRRILTERGGVGGDGIVSDDIAALDAARPEQAGILVLDDTTLTDALGRLMAPLAYWYCGLPERYSASGTLFRASSDGDVRDLEDGRWRITSQAAELWRCGAIALGAGAPVLTFRRMSRGVASAAGEVDIVALRMVATGDKTDSVPAWQITLHWGQNATVQGDGDLGGDKTSALDPVGGLAVRRALAAEWQDAVWTDAGVKTPFPTAQDVTLDSALQDDAAAAAATLGAVYGAIRPELEIDAHLDQAALDVLRLGATVEVIHPRYGLAAGQLKRVLSVSYDQRQRLATIGLGLGA